MFYGYTDFAFNFSLGTMVLLKSHSTVMQLSPYFSDQFLHVFALVTPERVFYFNTESESKRQQWFASINQAVQSSALDESSDDHVSFIISFKTTPRSDSF